MKIIIARHPMGHCFEVFNFGHGAPMTEPTTTNDRPARAWQFSTADKAVAAVLRRFPDAKSIRIQDHLAGGSLPTDRNPESNRKGLG